MKTPLLDKAVYDAYDTAMEKYEIDSPEWEAAQKVCNELEALKEALKVSQEQGERTSKALYDMQFVVHENLINKYCALKNVLKSLVEGFGYELKLK